jgi:hypothetical protein
MLITVTLILKSSALTNLLGGFVLCFVQLSNNLRNLLVCSSSKIDLGRRWSAKQFTVNSWRNMSIPIHILCVESVLRFT